MSDQPTLEEIESFVRGDLDHPRSSILLRHLVRGCRSCSEKSGPSLGVVPCSETEYDAVIDRVFGVAREVHRQRERERQEVRRIVTLLEMEGEEGFDSLSPGDYSPVLVESLLERSWALRHEDPGRMRELAHFATAAAGRLSLARYGQERVSDLLCRAWAELANACRVSERLDEAEAAFHRAYAHETTGSGDPMLTARLMDLLSSLYGARRNFRKVRELLVLVRRIYSRFGQKHHAGRALLSMGIYTGDAGEPAKALRLLQRGFKLIDEEFDPEMVFIAVHNQLWFTVDCGRFEEAEELLRLNRWRYQGAARLNRIKLRWLEARIDAGLGRHERAVDVFREVRDELREAGQDFPAALTTLDMALSLMRLGRTDEARDVVLETVEIFRRLDIQREVLATALFLREAFMLGLARISLLEDVIAFLRKAEHDPEARFEPRPGG